MLTVGSLVEGLGLELAAGQSAAATPVRWVHITELPDPTPWLSGGELLLTTGLQIRGDDELREFGRRGVRCAATTSCARSCGGWRSTGWRASGSASGSSTTASPLRWSTRPRGS